MDERELDQALYRLKDEMKVNQELKQNLRNEFTRRRKPRFLRAALVTAGAAAVACLLFITYILNPNSIIERAQAASLKIYNQVSFAEIGGGGSLSASEYNGTVYMPVFGKGLFAYDKAGFHKLLDGDISFARVSGDGKKIAVSANGSISIYDLAAKKSNEILKADDKKSAYYGEPEWSPDNQKIMFTEKSYEAGQTHGFSEKDTISEIDLKTLKVKKLADGSHGSYVNGTNSIVFERDNKIISRNLSDGKEAIVDSGRDPAVSPDGSYLAYVKTEHNERPLGPQAKVTEDIDNVWIADAGDFKTKKKVTYNFIHNFVDVDQWRKNLKPSKVPQVLGLAGQYSYYEPSWSNDSGSLFVLKNANADSGLGMRLVRIDFTSKKHTPEETVKKFLQALVVRDDDYARSFMKNPPSMLTVSNPHQVGYQIVGSGQDNGKVFVDADIYSEYTANPDYYIAKARFYLLPGDNGYIIERVDRIDEKTGISVTGDDTRGGIYITAQGTKKLLFRYSDIPARYTAAGKHRFGSLAYNEKTGDLVFTIQALQDKEQRASVYLLSYDLKNRNFQLLDHISRIGNMTDVGVESLVLDTTGKYAAIDLFSDNDKNFASHCLVYNLTDGMKVEIGDLFSRTEVTSVHTDFWDESVLVFKLASQGQSMGYTYTPGVRSVGSF